MKRNIQRDKCFSKKCPWWSNNVGLEQYIRFLLKQDSKHLNFSYFEINPWFLSVLLRQTTTFLNSISFEECKTLSDECIHILSEGFQYRGDHGLKHSMRPINSHLVVLNLEGCTLLTDKTCISISRYFIRLENLNIRNCTNISDEGFITLMRGCKYISELNISNLCRLHDDSLLAIKQNLMLMKLLRIIDMSGCTGFTNDAILSLFESNPNVLRNINLSYSPQIQLGISGLQRSNSSHITRLVLEGNHLSDSMMNWIGKGCKNLLELQLSHCTGISSLSLFYLFSTNNIRLKTLNLSNSDTVTNDTLNAFTKISGERLQILDLRNCSQVSSDSLIHLAPICPRLEKIILQGVNFCDTGIIELATHCPSLISINVSGNRSFRVPRIDKRSLISIGKCCSSLRFMIACGCSRLDDDAIIGLTKGCKYLEELNLKRCYKISDRALFAIGQNCRRLRKISLESCNVSSEGVNALTTGCSLLKEIDLSNSSQITDDAIKNLGSRCKTLKVVCLNNCDRITNDSIKPLLMDLPVISSIGLRGLDLVSDKAFSGSYLRFLRVANFESTSVDESKLKQLESISLFGTLSKSCALSIQPKYSDPNMHKQHLQYLSFLSEKRNLICYCIKRYLISLHCRNSRRVRNISSTKIQSSIRTYLCKKRYKKLLRDKVMFNSAQLISSAFKQYIRRKDWERKLNASELIYRSFYAYRFRVRIYRTIQIYRRKRQRQRIARDKALWFYLSLRIFLNVINRIKHAAVVIQNRWRKFSSVRDEQRNIFVKQRFCDWSKSFLNQEKENRITAFHAAVRIQDCVKLFILKKADIQRFQEARQAKKLRNEASRYIASFCERLSVARRTRFIIRAAQIIQIWAHNAKRKHAVRILWNRTVTQLVIKDSASRSICTWYRSQLHRKKMLMVLQQMTITSRRRSTEIIQRWFRQIQSKRLQNSRFIIQNHIIAYTIRKRDRVQEFKRIASIRIQCWIRCKLMVKLYHRKMNAVPYLQRWWRNQIQRRVFLTLFKQSVIKYNLLQKMRKKLLLEEQRQRKILSLFSKSKWNAASVIQRVFRAYVQDKRRIEAIEKREEEIEALEVYHTLKDKELLIRRQERKKLAYSTKKAARRLLNGTIKTLSNGIQSMYSIRDEMKRWYTERHEREELAPKILLYVNNYLDKSNVEDVSRYMHNIRDFFREYSWYNRECEKCMLENLIWPEEVLMFRRLWIEEIDFKREESVSIHNFFSWIRETRSEYGFWIIQWFLKTDMQSLISFSTYFYLVISSSLLSKRDLERIVFVSVSKYEKFMIKDEWTYLVNSLLENNDRNLFATKQFESYASKDSSGTHVLLFEDFVSLIRSCPFVMVPIYKFHNSIRRSHAGESYWRKKIKEILSARTRSRTTMNNP